MNVDKISIVIVSSVMKNRMNSVVIRVIVVHQVVTLVPKSLDSIASTTDTGEDSYKGDSYVSDSYKERVCATPRIEGK